MGGEEGEEVDAVEDLVDLLSSVMMGRRRTVNANHHRVDQETIPAVRAVMAAALGYQLPVMMEATQSVKKAPVRMALLLFFLKIPSPIPRVVMAVVLGCTCVNVEMALSSAAAAGGDETKDAVISLANKMCLNWINLEI